MSGGYTKAPPDAALAAKAATRAAKAGRRAAAKGGMKDKTGAEGGALGFRRFTSPGGYQASVCRRGAGCEGCGRTGVHHTQLVCLRSQFVCAHSSHINVQVLVGRSNIQNDHLSTKVAADSDLWMHVRGRPGSHTVLRCGVV